MPSLEPILNHVGPFLMVLFRLSGLFVFAPVVGSAIIPTKARALFAFMLAAALYPTIPPAQQAPLELDLFSLGAAVLAETMIGVSIGLLAALPMYAAQLAGLLMSQQVGMGLASLYNPALDAEADVIGQLLLYLALAVFAAGGGLESIFLAAASTFANVPVGQASLGMAPAEVLLGVVASGFEVALRVSAPVLCIILLETVASGVIMKTMPQMNIMSIGFAIKVLAALIALVAGLAAVDEVIRDDSAATTGLILEWAGGLGT